MEKEYDDLVKYLEKGEYPDGFNTQQRMNFKRRAKSFRMEEGMLLYVLFHFSYS